MPVHTPALPAQTYPSLSRCHHVSVAAQFSGSCWDRRLAEAGGNGQEPVSPLFNKTNERGWSEMDRNGWLGYLGSAASKWTVLMGSASCSLLRLLVWAPSGTPWVLQVYLTYPGWRRGSVRSSREEPTRNGNGLNLQVLKWDEEIVCATAAQKHH